MAGKNSIPPQENPWLVILNSSLADSELHRLLKMQQLRIKVSNSTLPHTCLYPQSSIAFMILPTSSILTSWPPTEQSSITPLLTENIEKFSKLHHRRYILVTSPLIGGHEQIAIGMLQNKYLFSGVEFLPMHNSRECMSCMLNIAKVTCRPLSDLIRKRMAALEAQLVSEESILFVLREFGLSEQESFMVLDGCGGLAGLARASAEELRDLNLTQETVKSVMCLLHGN